MAHTLDFHKTCLNKLCRICGCINQTKKQMKNRRYPVQCDKLATDLLLMFSVDLDKDDENTHSKFVCPKCNDNIKTIKRRKSAVSLKSAQAVHESATNIWCRYTESQPLSECSVCAHTEKMQKGCMSKIGIKSPRADTFQSLTHVSHIETEDTGMQDETCPSSILHTQSFEVVNEFDMHSSETNVTTADLDNSILFEEMNATQISEIFETSNSNGQTDDMTLNPIPPHITASTPLKPKPQTVDMITSPCFKQDKINTLTHSLEKPLHEPLTKMEEKIATRLVKRKLHTDQNKKVIKCKTKGQPLHLQVVVKPRKTSEAAAASTVRSRSQFLDSTRSYIADTSDAQLTHELKRVPSKRRENICENANVKQKVKLTKKQIVALKEELGFSWRQTRKLAMLLKKVGVRFENEQAVREYAREIVQDFVKVETRTFEREDGEYQAPFGRVVNLSQFLDYMLNSYEDKNLLTWHNNTIPQDEIWVKIGGDHGKHSLKLTLSIANTNTPNSKLNTIVIAIASVKDSHTNIVRFLDSGVGRDINGLNTHTWKGKKIKVFLNGDYEFLSKVYGLSGPAGTYACLWCLIPSRTLRFVKTNPFQTRTLELLHTDNKNFLEQSKGDKKCVSRHNNSLHAPLIQLELDHVAPPYLHILLGITVKHHRLLEKAAHELDLKIASQPTVHLTELGERVRMYGKNWKDVRELEERLKFEQSCVILSECEDDVTKYTECVRTTEKQLSAITYTDFTPRSGPVASSLDPILKKHHITPQAYHSRSFIGNHCHKYLQTHVYTELTQSVVTMTKACTSNPFLVDQAHILELNFNHLNEAFSQVHKAISHSKPMKDSLTQVQASVQAYMEIYRRNCPKQTIPKQHILEHHTISFIEQHRFGLSLLGEQGTENSHQSIRKLEKRARGIVNPEEQLKFVLTAHMLQVSPKLREEF